MRPPEIRKHSHMEQNRPMRAGEWNFTLMGVLSCIERIGYWSHDINKGLSDENMSFSLIMLLEFN